MNLRPVSKIDFGSADGKKEARNPSFETLFYLGDGYYDRLIQNDKYLVVGRKGTGKSLLIQYFKKQMDKNKDTYCKLITMPQFMRKKLDVFSYENIHEEEMETFWRYVFLKELIGIILENDTQLFNGSLSDIKKTKDDFSLALKEVTMSESVGLSASLSLKKPEVGAKLANDDKATYVPGKYYDNLDDLSDIVMKYMKKTKCTFFIIFDDIDELKNKFEKSEDFKKIILAFLNALETINDDLYEHSTDSKIISTFRSDLIEQLNSEANNLNKILYDSTIDIKWFSRLTKTDPKNAPLSKMIMHKARNSIADYLNLSDEQLYESLFPSFKTQAYNTTSEYLMFHSFGRPRDIIIFLQTYQRLFPEDTSFKYENFGTCLGAYSGWFYGELLNEINISEDKDSILCAIEVLKKLSRRSFYFSEFENFYEQNKDKYSFCISNIQKTISQLYLLGVIGNVAYRKKASNRYWFSYREGSSSEPDFSQKFIVHFGLQNYLSL